MEHSAEFHRCLEACDVAGIRRIAAHVFQHLPQPKTDAEALAMIHLARTQMPAMPMKLRIYSHWWLLDHGLPSALPDELKPAAERLYPRTVGVVGISVNSQYPFVREAITGVMSDAVLEAQADGHGEDHGLVRRRMMEAREREKRGLGLL